MAVDHYLTKERVPAWWAAHQGEPLKKVRVRSAQEALDEARKAHADPAFIRFLQDHLKTMKAGRWPM